jgi:hypothetical protein
MHAFCQRGLPFVCYHGAGMAMEGGRGRGHTAQPPFGSTPTPPMFPFARSPERAPVLWTPLERWPQNPSPVESRRNRGSLRESAAESVAAGAASQRRHGGSEWTATRAETRVSPWPQQGVVLTPVLPPTSVHGPPHPAGSSAAAPINACTQLPIPSGHFAPTQAEVR